MTRRLIGWAARFYPRAWRERYGDEFLATVEDMPAPSWLAAWDVWRGAMAMQIHLNGGRLFQRAAILGLAGFTLAGLISLRVPDEYLATSLLGAANVDPESVRQSAERVLSRRQLLALVDKHKLYPEERARLPLEDIVETMRKSIKVSALRGKDPARRAFEVGFVYDNGPAAQRVTNDLVAALLQENQASMGGELLTVLDSAPDPAPIYPNRPMFAFAGLLGGALLGAVWALFRGA